MESEKELNDKIKVAIRLIKEKLKDVDFAFSGSFGLYLQGIKFRRPHDIDIVFLKNSDEEIKRFKDLYASIFNETGFLIDILRYYDGEENNVTISFEGEEVKSITVEIIIKFKKLFCSDEFKLRDFVKRKHKRDLVEIEKWLNNQDSKVVWGLMLWFNISFIGNFPICFGFSLFIAQLFGFVKDNWYICCSYKRKEAKEKIIYYI